ncbi:MAG: enoyl-CoA hydratase/isomerase [Dehalococcoidia bacterium]|nr:enoyl-CoA hydratase/isomerase [Dehalococcoidia bacterium]
MAEYKNVIYEVREHVAIITNNNPERLNALSVGLKRDIEAAMMEAAHNSDVRAIIWTGAGRGFSAGANMGGRGDEDVRAARAEEGEQGLLGAVQSAEEFREWGLRWQINVPQPIIGAINGYALGRGFEYALHSDILIASERAVFGAPEIRHGTIAASRLPFLVGPMWAKRIILTGDHVRAETALRIGLVIDVVPHEKLMDAAFALAKRISYVPYYAVRYNKRMIDGTMEAMGMNTALAYSSMLDAIGHATSREHPLIRATDGADLRKIQKEGGTRAFIQARDEPFGPSPHL